MKKGAVVLLIVLFINLSFVIADESQDKIDKAYNCLQEKVKDKCSSLSFEGQIFSLLSIGECKKEIEEGIKDEHWTALGSTIKPTALAILALNKKNENTKKSEEWLINQNANPSEIEWFLEIETTEASTCTITYENSPYTINIGEDKKIDSDAGACLTKAYDNYWLEISSTCLDKTFTISCNKRFLTTLLFKKANLETIHVSDITQSADASGVTTEKIDSLCFKQGTSCNYEGSLWASIVLDYLGYDMSSFKPYLVTMADEETNEKYFPDTFLYALTGYSDFYTNVIKSQKTDGSWLVSIDKFYDTALALSVLDKSDSVKTKAINWLLGVQGENGCWDNSNVKNTAFILYAISDAYSSSIPPSPEPTPTPNGGEDCEDLKYYCISSISCNEAGGNELVQYSSSCFGVNNICCDKPAVEKTCSELGGKVCYSDTESCTGTTISAEGLSYGEICCIDGICKEPSEQKGDANCKSNGGTCRTSVCESNEEESSFYTCDSENICCVEKSSEKLTAKNAWLIWVLLGAIGLALLGILFRNKLRELWFKFKGSGGHHAGGRPGGLFPPSSSIPLRNITGRIFPQSQSPKPVLRRPEPKGEISEVLKKLKEMGK